MTHHKKSELKTVIPEWSGSAFKTARIKTNRLLYGRGRKWSVMEIIFWEAGHKKCINDGNGTCFVYKVANCGVFALKINIRPEQFCFFL